MRIGYSAQGEKSLFPLNDEEPVAGGGPAGQQNTYTLFKETIMVRPVTEKRTPSWIALSATVAAVVAVVWHIVACVESPMAFSLEGDLSFVTMEPYSAYPKIAGKHVFRLMVLSRNKELRIIEETGSHLLTAPAYSPDGKRLCYLRIPLPSHEDDERVKAFMDGRNKQYEEMAKARPEGKWVSWVEAGSSKQPPSEPSTFRSSMLPKLKPLALLAEHHTPGGTLLPAELVVRDTETNEEVTTLDVVLPISDKGDLFFSRYGLTQPQYGPDGEWIYFGLRGFVISVNPSTGERRLWGISQPASLRLSPNGKTLAIFLGDTLGFIQTDGRKAIYLRLPNKPSFSRLAWVNDETLAVLGDGNNDQVPLDLFHSDGRLLQSRTLPLVGQGTGKDSGELAIALNGKHIAVSFGKHVHFLTTAGQMIGSWQHESDLLVQPAYAPDSRSLAFKYMDEDEKRATAIVFFTPEGKELSRIPIPAADLEALRTAPETAEQSK